MHRKSQIYNLRTISPAATAALRLVVLLAPLFPFVPPAQAQTYTIIHNFSGEEDGGNPFAGVTVDASHNLYGTTTMGYTGFGSVFKMIRKNSNWILTPLYNFTDEGDDGAYPYGRVVRDTSGALYGSTVLGGGANDGTVFKLQPSPFAPLSVTPPWKESTLHSFIHDGSDGVGPFGTLVFDQAGNLYGTTEAGGTNYDGAVFKLTPSNGGWTESVLYSFAGGNDGAEPWAGVVLDGAGNLYGTTRFGGAYDCGTVFQLTSAGSLWTERVLYSFMGNGDGCRPQAGVILDRAGNLYGATVMTSSGEKSGGTVFELSPSNGKWNYRLLYTFNGGTANNGCSEGWGSGPTSSLTMDGDGNFYGTTSGNGAYGVGNVFKLASSNGGWTYISLHDFSNVGWNDGENPCGGVTLDASGNLYGTTISGGVFPYTDGIVWEITP